ncbi:MAG: isochorismatase family protein [Candidatus Eremiobacteraeota bacterium]|nr:isochorismatase family protein [Candidatus Eremiobacteraeota bacterium]
MPLARKNSHTRRALLVIDVQDSFKVGERWLRRNNPSFEDNVTRLIGAFRANGRPVIYFLDNDDDEHFSHEALTIGSWISWLRSLRNGSSTSTRATVSRRRRCSRSCFKTALVR